MHKYDDKLFCDVYAEICDELGIEVAEKLHEMYKGQQISFPVHLYDSRLIAEAVAKEYDGSNMRALARKYSYSEKTLRRMIKK